jgi:transcriptional regulator with XRE-family HTH domain
MQDWRIIVGKNVRRIRQQRRMIQEELAFEAELDLTYIGGIERERRNPSLPVSVELLTLCQFRSPSSSVTSCEGAPQRGPGYLVFLRQH